MTTFLELKWWVNCQFLTSRLTVSLSPFGFTGVLLLFKCCMAFWTAESENLNGEWLVSYTYVKLWFWWILILVIVLPCSRFLRTVSHVQDKSWMSRNNKFLYAFFTRAVYLCDSNVKENNKYGCHQCCQQNRSWWQLEF